MRTRRAWWRAGGFALCATVVTALGGCSIERNDHRPQPLSTPTIAPRAGAGASRVAVPPTTTLLRDHVRIDAPCTRDGDARTGGTAIVAVWESTVALACGAMIDTATGRRAGWLEPSGVVTLATGTVLGWRDLARTADQPAAREYVTVDATGRASSSWGVLPKDVSSDANLSWLPTAERGVLVGLHRPAWFERSRASGASQDSTQPTVLHVYDSATGTRRVVDPVTQFALDRDDAARWWVVDGQLLLSSRKRGVIGLRASDMAVVWTASPELLGGTLVEDALDFGRLGVLAVRRATPNDRVGLDVRSGSVLLSPRATAVVDGTMQVTGAVDLAVLHELQLFVGASGASAVRAGQRLWTYGDVRGPCDFATLPPAQPTGIVMACRGFVAFQRA